MSADNGIYILKTKAATLGPESGFEFRVIHAQAIENIYYNLETGEYNQDFTPQEAFDYFGNAPEFWDEKDALQYASELSDNHDILEYGICFLNHPDQVFQTFTKEEMETYEAEVDETMRRVREEREVKREAQLQAATISFREGMVFEPGAIYGYLVREDGTKIHGSLSGVKQLTTRLERIGPTAYAVHTECIIGRGETLEFLPSDWHKE